MFLTSPNFHHEFSRQTVRRGHHRGLHAGSVTPPRIGRVSADAPGQPANLKSAPRAHPARHLQLAGIQADAGDGPDRGARAGRLGVRGLGGLGHARRRLRRRHLGTVPNRVAVEGKVNRKPWLPRSTNLEDQVRAFLKVRNPE